MATSCFRNINVLLSTSHKSSWENNTWRVCRINTHNSYTKLTYSILCKVDFDHGSDLTDYFSPVLRHLQISILSLSEVKTMNVTYATIVFGGDGLGLRVFNRSLGISSFK